MQPDIRSDLRFDQDNKPSKQTFSYRDVLESTEEDVRTHLCTTLLRLSTKIPGRRRMPFPNPNHNIQ